MESTGERFIPLAMDGRIAAEHLNRYLFVCHTIPLKGKKVLDIASGAGYGSNLMADYASQIYGIDISQEAVDYATLHYKKDNISFLQGDCRAIPLADHSVDLVVSFETIEHTIYHEEFCSEIVRVLKPDGVLVMSSPNKRQYTDIPGGENPYHVKELYTDEFLALVKKHFMHVEQYGQSYALTSMIYPIKNSQNTMSRPMECANSAVQELDPLYNIAIASNVPLPQHSNPAVIIHADNVTISNLERIAKEEERAACHKTPSWKLGHTLLHPLKSVRSLFCKH